MVDSLSSMAMKHAKPLIPYILQIPKPILTLVPSIFLHSLTNPIPTPSSLLKDPLIHPLHLPLLLLFITIPIIYLLGLISGKVSWVDKIWTFYPPLFSTLILLWAMINPSAGIYAHNIPRMTLMLLGQYLWSIRITSHAIRRGFFELGSEDYRYTIMRKLLPKPIWSLVHLFAVAIPQPTLLFLLCLPLYAVLMYPPSELSYGPIPSLSIPFSWFKPFFPAKWHTAADDNTPVLNILDLFVFTFAVLCVMTEYLVDNEMFKFQEAKHNPPANAEIIKPKHTNPPNQPPAGSYPVTHYPGFPTKGWWRFSRHPNFAAEQLFWGVQPLFVVAAGRGSQVTKSRWIGGDAWSGAFAVAFLFSGSTILTEWITQKKYPLYKEYKNLVGQFIPQSTIVIYIWGVLTGTRQASWDKIYGRDPKTGTISSSSSERTPLIQSNGSSTPKKLTRR